MPNAINAMPRRLSVRRDDDVFFRGMIGVMAIRVLLNEVPHRWANEIQNTTTVLRDAMAGSTLSEGRFADGVYTLVVAVGFEAQKRRSVSFQFYVSATALVGVYSQ